MSHVGANSLAGPAADFTVMSIDAELPVDLTTIKK